MLNLEELLIKLMQVLDIDLNDVKLKQTVEKDRFITREESSIQYEHHRKLIFKALDFDSQNEALVGIFDDLLFLYVSIRNRLVQRNYEKNFSTKKINWIILKRLVIPFLAYRLAELDSNYENRIDKNMPGGFFWYLPSTKNPKDIKMPVASLMNWWLDLYGKGLRKLCDEIDINSKEKQAFSSFNILKTWTKDTLPNRKSLELYLGKELKYSGVFKANKEDVDSLFEETVKFIENKKIELEKLKDEIPEPTLLKKIFNNKEKITQEEKKKFIKIVKDRWSEPSKKSLIQNFLIARVVQDSYKRLIRYFDFEETDDIEKNKVLQLVYQYEVLYNNHIIKYEDELYHEMVSPFFNPSIEQILNTICADVFLELENPNVDKKTLEDNYLLKFIVFTQYYKDERSEEAFRDAKKFNEYFHERFHEVERKIKNYRILNINDFIEKILEENDVLVLSNLYTFYCIANPNDYNYEKSEKICIQHKKVSVTNNDKIGALGNFATLYCTVWEEKNQSKFTEIKIILAELSEFIDENNKDNLSLLYAQFFLKSKEFQKSLEAFDKYYEKNIIKKRKENDFTTFVYMASYCAYTVKDKKRLKKYNTYLKKYGSHKFDSKKDLPFPVFFYK